MVNGVKRLMVNGRLKLVNRSLMGFVPRFVATRHSLSDPIRSVHGCRLLCILGAPSLQEPKGRDK
jgi:hypothetical protein